MRKLLIIFFIVIALIVAVPVARGIFGGGAAVTVDTGIVARHDLQASVLASGRLAHEDEVNLMIEEIGRVTELHVKEGDRVEAGQLLLRIDDETHRAALEQNAAQVRLQDIAIERQQLLLANLSTQWQRQQRLFDQGLVDQDSFDMMTNDLRLAEIDLQSTRQQLSQARAQLEQAEDRLRKTRVFSPINGVVTALNIEVGETAISSTTNVPGSQLMTIANPDSIHTEVNVDEADIANVEVGQKANVYAIAYPDTPIPGVIEQIAVSARTPEGSQGLSFEVKIRLEPPGDIRLRPGMSCRAEIYTTTTNDVLAVPIQAVLVDENRARNLTTYAVFVNEGGIARRVEVEVGVSDDAFQEIVAGVDEGAEIVVGPDRVLRALEDGQAIQPSGS